MASRFQRFTTMLALGCLLGITSLQADTFKLNPTAPTMLTIDDVLGGQRYLLRDDEVNLLQVYQLNGQTYTSVKTFPTANSHFEHTNLDTSITLTTSPSYFNGVPSSVGFGRMLNTSNDQIAAISPGPNTPSAWTVTVADPVTQTKLTQPIGSKFAPAGGVYTQVVMGNFDGRGLSEALLFYASTAGQGNAQLGMTIVAATQSNAAEPFALTIGPELFTHVTNGFGPITGSIVAGDFNGDGRDEIAALFTDNLTIQFYTVDQNTL